MRIGRAGEKRVSYACVVTETYRHFGRLGLGAVFGSKNLKAILIYGKKSFKVKNSGYYNKTYKKIFKLAIESKKMRKYHDLGTAANILPLNKIKSLPTMNLKASEFDFANEISGENLAEKFLGRRLACSHCPVGCIHLAALRVPYEHEPYFYKTTYISYDYELIFSLGSMLGVRSPDALLKLIGETEILGLDAISSGVSLAWATEAFKKGLISKKESIVELEFGKWENYIKALRYIVEQPNEFYSSLAKGCDFASKRFGGEEFALSFAGNEMAGYHTGPASYVNFLTGARHSHLDSAGYSYDQKIGEADPKKIANALFTEESWRQILSSLVVCFFARGIYTEEIIRDSLESIGITVEDLKRIGTRILRDKYKFKFREGFKFEKLRIPRRIFETEAHIKIDEKTVKEAINEYKRLLLGSV